jgi:hypothetical protein
MDEQITSLLEQRQKLEHDFRDAQAEVNAECERMLRSASIAPAKILAQMAEHSTAINEGGGNGRASMKPVMAAVG